MRTCHLLSRVLLFLLLPAVVSAGLEELEESIVEFELDNGLRFIVVERPSAPVFSYCTQVNAGGVDEVPGITGVAHMFEHMAFKGTKTIGTTDYETERAKLDEVDEVFLRVLEEREKGPHTDAERLGELEAELDEAIRAAGEYVVTNEFTQILNENGVVGLNAQTGLDFTRYFYSLPSNRLELWALLESDRLTNPVLREFETERAVVIEERRGSAESTPIGRLFTNFLALSFPAHPYGDGIIGHASDLRSFTREDAWEFFEKYYVAPNIRITIVGDVDADEVRDLAETYFSRVPTGPLPLRVKTIEPPQIGERRLTIEEESQPMVFVGYPIPDVRHPDYLAYELLGLAVGSGRSSRLYTRLVKERELAAQVQAGAGFPGEKYPNLFVALAFVSAGKDPYETETAIEQLLEEDLAANPITQEELDGARTEYKASVIRSMRSNSGLAMALAMADQLRGHWRELFDTPERLDTITVDDLNRVARETFAKKNRNVGLLVRPSEEG